MIRHKLVLLLATTGALAALTIGLVALPLVRSVVRERYIERLRAEADLLSAWIAVQPAPGAPQTWAREWGARLDLRLTLIDAAGRVIGDSSASSDRLAELGDHSQRPEVQQAVREGWGQSYRVSVTTGEEFFFLARQVEGGGAVSFVRIAAPAWQVRRAEHQFLGLAALLPVAAPLVVTVLAYFAVRRWSRPLERLATDARRVAAGDLDTVVASANNNDESGAAAAAVERMRRTLVGEITRLGGEHALLGAVLDALQDGLLLVNVDGRVRLSNEAFRRAWGVRSDPTGRPLAEVVRQPEILAAVETASSSRDEVRAHVADPAATGRAFELHVAPLTAPHGAAGVVLLFFDVTRLEALEGVRKEFVANLSHELRSPLTAIKAAVLTLIEGCDEASARERFLEAIRRNAERMAALVEDLTDLSLIETGAIKLDVCALDAAPLIADVIAQVSPRYAALNLSVDVDLPTPFLVKADRRRLEQILVNLLDNAMKFNRVGGAVRVRGGASGGRTLLSVEDTGIGVPSDHLERIFHRFHRVDPARSQELGGTGLGLAIVKHLVQLHGGVVRVTSELGEGTTFTVEL